MCVIILTKLNGRLFTSCDKTEESSNAVYRCGSSAKLQGYNIKLVSRFGVCLDGNIGLRYEVQRQVAASRARRDVPGTVVPKEVARSSRQQHRLGIPEGPVRIQWV
ncbi:hypothetical protein C0J52_08309 [Blattella germanica]|nr:hypothetical protein C0J52_08309 [Blattella germanica]